MPRRPAVRGPRYLELAYLGHTNAEIAAIESVSVHTVDATLRDFMGRQRIPSRGKLFMWYVDVVVCQERQEELAVAYVLFETLRAEGVIDDIHQRILERLTDPAWCNARLKIVAALESISLRTLQRRLAELHDALGLYGTQHRFTVAAEYYKARRYQELQNNARPLALAA